MKNTIINLVVGTVLLSCFFVCAYKMGEASQNKPVNDFIWIDNNRVHKDSIIDLKPIYNEYGKQIGEYIRVSHGDTQVFIECLNNPGYTYQEFRDSWLMAFREQS